MEEKNESKLSWLMTCQAADLEFFNPSIPKILSLNQIKLSVLEAHKKNQELKSEVKDVFVEGNNIAFRVEAAEITSKDYDIAIGYENSEIFNDWCSRRIDNLLLYYLNLKPTPLKIKVYMDHLTQNLVALAT